MREKQITTLDFKAGHTLLFNKPKTWSSFDVVKKVRGILQRHLGEKLKVGHAGTLDPLASGLLIICTGKHTKQIESFQDLEKTYEVLFKLGATTPSYDAEFPEENIQDASHITREAVGMAIQNFTGEITQLPPVFSAVKIDGKRAYKSARKGKEVAVRPRFVTVSAFELLEFESPAQISARVTCSKGTYIRSLVHDLGQHLQTGGYIRELVRTQIGHFAVKDAWEIADFEQEFRGNG
ncbi:MAG: tRNA pseudouridine(55) synthase TruB [Bacteroidota bacterium]